MNRKGLNRAALLSTALGLSLLAAGLLVGASHAQTAAPAAPTQFSLSADAEVAAAPDIAVLQMGVNATARTAAEALRLDREKMYAAIAALKAAGVAAKDIQTSGLSLNAQYAYEQNQPPRLTGYQASNTVSATVRDVTKAGAVVDAVTAAGANQVNGISFDLSDRRKAEDEARRAAVRALSDKVALYAEATGLHILRLASLSEGGGVIPSFQPRPVYAMAKMADASPSPVEPGELKVRITVSGVYELSR